MPWPPEDPDMWAVEAAFGKHNKRKDEMGNEDGKFRVTHVDGHTAVVPPLPPEMKLGLHQVAGDHYSKMAIQPATFSRANDYDSDAFSILKYLSRHKAKKGREDVEKALSFVYIRDDNKDFFAFPRWQVITSTDFCRQNGINGDDAAALLQLDAWVRYHPRAAQYEEYKRHLIETIQDILTNEYPVK